MRRYVMGLFRALLALPDAPSVVALGGTGGALPPGIAHVPEPPHPPTNLGWAIVGLPLAAVRAGVDLIHAPAYTGPAWSPIPSVVTIHDVSYERRPEWYPYKRDPIRTAFYRRSARAAAQVITDSLFSKAEIQAAYGMAATRIAVVPLGVDAAFTPAVAGVPGDLPPEVSTPFLLHVGDLHERRNLGIVVEAMGAARHRCGQRPRLSLVLAGPDRGAGDGLSALAARLAAPEAVVRLGMVSEEMLVTLYRRAEALVYPSLYEGFGLPVLEAMACGTPVIASTAGSIPEVIGTAGILVDPMNQPGWVEAIVRVVEGHQLGMEMRQAGIDRAAQFTWERTARLTAAVYQQVVRA